MNDSARSVEAIFSAALARTTPADRGAYLDEACGGNGALRARIDALLAAHDRAGDLLSRPAPWPGASTGDDTVDTGDIAAGHRPFMARAQMLVEQPGSAIDHYKLLQRIGEGGFGTVWMADQERPVRRRVALKIIKAGMDTKEVIARFEQERQALAMMDHPNIAKVLDAGATDTGRPYFVMELVRGVKITEYCDDQGLSTKERINLFITVCHAVQHAHQKGIIHRDLKPSNILVTINDGEAVPKVIDFGVAKATQGRLTDGTLFTQFEQMIGTPLYMSPEQAEITSLDVDTRSDIYSLGVLLYELLTGRTPIDTATMAKAGMNEVRRLIREVDPPRPSARLKSLDGNELTTVAKRRQTEPTRLSGTLRGDIDWIVMKCLEKDRKRRYDTANGLAMDLQRHIANEVVIARPPTTAYLLSKLVRRNKVACVAGAAIAVSLLVGIAASVWQAVRADHAATLARSAEQRAVETVDELRATAPAFAEQARALAAKEQYTDAIAKLDYAIKLRPDAAEFLVAKADLLQCQLLLASAVPIYRDALRVQPGHARAEASARLCEELLAAPPAADGKLSRESLAKLHVAMQQQQRPAAELLPVARLLGEEKKLLHDYWLVRLKDLPVSAENPLAKRLTVREDGRLALDLSGTKVTDLSPLAGAPLALLSLDGCTELTDLSPLAGLALTELRLGETGVADLTPLREMRSLVKLSIHETQVADLTPLSALRLTLLDLTHTQVTDLTPIQNMPLDHLSLNGTRVTDLSPLSGMPIKVLYLDGTPVRDISPLARMPLQKCYLGHTQITDLTALRGRPLKELSLVGCGEARSYAALTEIPTLESLLLPITFRSLPDEDLAAIGALRSHPRLRQIQAEFRPGLFYTATQSKDIFWQDWDRVQTFLPALRQTGFTFTLSKLPSGSYHLYIDRQPLRDLSILQGAPISELTLYGCPVSDLTPIRDLKLEDLRFSGDALADLSPLRGMPLKALHLSGAKITDVAPLARLPLRELYLDGCQTLTDIAALAEISTLEKLTVPLQAQNLDALRPLPRLRRLAFHRHSTSNVIQPATTVEDFWKDYVWISRLRAAGIKPWTLMRLEDGTWEVSFQGNAALTDLATLSGAPISVLALGGTAVSDLEPLRGMPLKTLQLYGLKLTDLSPLRGMPLEDLWLGTYAGDLSVLRGMPLRKLKLHDCAATTDFSPLAEAKELTSLTLPAGAQNIDFLRAFPKLGRIGFKEDWKNGGRPDKTTAEFWKEYDRQGWLRALHVSGVAIKSIKELPDCTWELDLRDAKISDLTILKGAPISRLNLKKTAVTDLSPLHGLPLKTLILDDTAVTDLRPLQGTPIEELELRRIKIADLVALRGMALKKLQLGEHAITDLEPLRGMALTDLGISKTRVTDLSPLAGMPLEYLDLNGTQVTDISVVRGMPLTKVRLRQCAGLTDLSPLAEAKGLTSLSLPPNAKDIEFLRAFPKLERLSFMEDTIYTTTPDKTAAEFWKEWDAKKKAK